MPSVQCRVETATSEYVDTVTTETVPSKGDLIGIETPYTGTRYRIDDVCWTPYRRRDHEAILIVSLPSAKVTVTSPEGDVREVEMKQGFTAKAAPAKKAPAKKAVKSVG
jgi:hypothetical protein